MELPNRVPELIEQLEQLVDYQIDPSWSIERIMWHAGRAELVKTLRFRLDTTNQFEKDKDIIMKGK